MRERDLASLLNGEYSTFAEDAQPEGAGSLTEQEPSEHVAGIDLSGGVEPGEDGEAPDPEPVPSDPVPSDPVISEPPPVINPAPAEDPQAISASRILTDRPDVLKAFYTEYHGANNDHHSTAWANRVGDATPEAYATYWYKTYGKYDGYSQGATTAQDNISLSKILADRPDVLRAYYSEYYGGGNDRHSEAWIKRVGGDTPEDYAKYWYNKYGKWEGYAQTDRQAAESINVDQLLRERPDVFQAFFTEYYGAHNDRHSSAWVDRVGGDTVQDYAKYWFETYGKAEGYTQHRPAGAAPDETPVEPAPSDPSEAPPREDPSLDPWNHPAIYPDWQPPYEGWTPPDSAHAAIADEIAQVGQSLGSTDLFG